ncbi:hypothetical protein JWH16_04400 [Xanthomonas campestris pv. campestris]|uniref:DNA-primase RepB domain-containing protein n=1 Tax=Xanthomonas campestris TaxID=339 RepID=UPI001E29B075|nr:DNA-primase RepB domain-containing protein [Xanthomonas campestris]MCD0253095.1 hypothetical protein [Xanthomonas campestris pv. campestris]
MNRQSATDRAVALQLAALAHERYEVGVTLPPKPGQEDERMMIRRWDAAELERSIAFLKSQNAKGSHIYIRPHGTHAYSFVDDLSLQKLADMKSAGFPPALVVESSPNNYQAWIAHGQTLDAETSTGVAKSLASRFGGDPSSADWRHFGRLAGFTNRKPKYELDGRFPFVKVTEADGRIAPASAELISHVCHAIAEQKQLASALRSSYQSVPQATGLAKTIDDFRASPVYGGDAHRADLAYATYAISRQVPLQEIEATLRSRDLTHKGSTRRQKDYIDRTLKKAQENARGPAR